MKWPQIASYPFESSNHSRNLNIRFLLHIVRRLLSWINKQHNKQYTVHNTQYTIYISKYSVKTNINTVNIEVNIGETSFSSERRLRRRCRQWHDFRHFSLTISGQWPWKELLYYRKFTANKTVTCLQQMTSWNIVPAFDKWFCKSATAKTNKTWPKLIYQQISFTNLILLNFIYKSL